MTLMYFFTHRVPLCHHGLNTKLDGHVVADVDADAQANVTCKQSFMELLNSDVICS